MSRGFTSAVLKALGAGEHRLTVVGAADLTPHCRRIDFASPTLFDGPPFEPAGWIRLWVPDLTRPDRFHQRGYTLVDADPETGRFSVDFVLHEPDGPATRWARHAAVGDELAATRYGGSKFAIGDPVPDGFLLVGDPAALPGMSSIIEALPADRPVRLVLEQAHDDDRDLPIADHPLLTVTWVPATGSATTLADAIPDGDWSNWWAWVAAEMGAVRRIRERLKALGFPRSEVLAQAYWARGRAMGRTDDRGADPVPADEPAPPSAPDVARGDVREATSRPGRWRVRAGSELLAPLKTRLVLAGIAQGVVSLLQLAPFLLVAELCRRALTGADDGLADLAVTALVLFGAGTAIAAALVVATHVMDARFGFAVRTAVVAKLARMPLGWFTDHTSGRVKRAVHDDATSLHYLVTHAVLDVVAVVVTPLAVLAYLFTVDGALAAVLLVPVVVFAVLMGRMARASGDRIAKAAEWTTRTESEAIAYLDGLPVVRVYDADGRGAFRRTLDEHARFLHDWQSPFTGQKAVIEMVTRPATSLLLIVAAGTGLVAVDALEPVDLVPFLLLGVTFGAQLMAIAYGFAGLREATAAARRVGLLLAEPELPAPDEPVSPPPAVGGRTVRFANVSFAYRPPRRVVADVDLELAPGTVTALVGPSGAGKSTLAALLARFHDVTEGAVTVDGVDLRDMSTDELYRTVGFVFQDVSLVRGTVRDNIALARPDADDEAVTAAARAAAVHDRVLRLPDGYDTVLDGRTGLSGGEAQRVQIARAILADPPVLVLDEATAFADSESEHDVQRALSRLVADRTVLVIAHRLHTIVDADAIVVLDDGRIVQRGRHADLVDVPGRYRDLWNAARREPSPAPADTTRESA